MHRHKRWCKPINPSKPIAPHPSTQNRVETTNNYALPTLHPDYDESKVTIEIQKATLPKKFEIYIQGKLMKSKEGGRPNLLQKLQKEKRDAKEEVLNILEMIWLKDKGLRQVAKKYKTTYITIWRLVRDLEDFKDGIITFLTLMPRRKMFYKKETQTSDYESVQAYINRAKRERIRTWRDKLNLAKRCWRYLNHKDPANWTADEVVEFLDTLSYGAKPNVLDGIRQVAPHLKDQVKTGRYREKLRRRKKNIFAKETKMIIETLRGYNLHDHETVFKLHVTLGAREGARNTDAGLIGISWDRFKDNFIRVDLWESKVRGGIWSRNCPVELFFKDLPQRLKELWVLRGKPTTEKLIRDYKKLRQVYKDIRQALAKHYKGKLEPSLFKELTTLKPHDADKIHVNLLWEAGVPIEVVAGQFIGKGEGIGLMGRIWLSTDTIKKHYLSLTQRSERYRRLLRQVEKYSARFNGYCDEKMTVNKRTLITSTELAVCATPRQRLHH